MIRIADLAERYNLHGLQRKIINHAKKIIFIREFPSDQFMEVAKLAEEFHVYTELSEAIHEKKDFCGGDGYFGQKKLAEKVRKSRQNVNRDKSA